MQLHVIFQDGSSDGLQFAPPPQAHEMCEFLRSLYEREGFTPPWTGYLSELEGALIGCCLFKTPPVDNFIEIAYFTFPGFEGHGHASEMARQLIAIARANAPGIIVKAQTQPQSNASTSVLKKLGFTLRGTVKHPEDGDVWEWLLIERKA